MKRRLAAVLAVLVAISVSPSVVGAACVGDCNGDRAVSVDEIVRAVNVALGTLPLSQCMAADRDGNLLVTVDEIIAAVRSALNGCTQPTATPTFTASPTATPTRPPNRPPQLDLPVWYRAYPLFEVALPLRVTDPDNDPVQCALSGLPATAQWSGAEQVLRWTPTDDDVGVYEIAVRCEDQGTPPLAVDGVIAITVAVPDGCAEPQCDPVAGCSLALPSVAAPCCVAPPHPRLPDPALPCPAGRVLWVSEDIDGGFQPLRNCDWKRLLTNLQQSAQLRLKLGGRCFSLDDRIRVRVRLETATRGLGETEPAVDSEYLVRFSAAENEQVFSGPVAFPIRGPAPYFDLQDAEGNLTVYVRDALNNTASESLRLRLTFTPIPTPAP